MASTKVTYWKRVLNQVSEQTGGARGPGRQPATGAKFSDSTVGNQQRVNRQLQHAQMMYDLRVSILNRRKSTRNPVDH